MSTTATRIRAGNLRHRLTIESNIADPNNPNSDGEVVANWHPDAIVWGSVTPLSGRKLMEAQQVNTETTHEIVMRGYTDVREDEHPKRIKFKDRVFYMTQPPMDMDERGIKVVVMAKERV